MKTIWALHGFLGLPSDWSFLKGLSDVHLVAVDLYRDIDDFWSWAERFNNEVSATEGEHHLLGYSLGGRLALHAFLSGECWTSATIVSTHPGLETENEKKQRVESDEVWARAWESEPWSDVLARWNGQSVLSSSLERKEEDYNRERLAKMMRLWSLGHQENLRDRLADVKTPVLWLTGENDKKFSDLAKELPQSIAWEVMSGVGHRIPMQAPDHLRFKLLEHLDKN